MKKFVLAGILIAAGCSGSHTATAPTTVEPQISASITADSAASVQQTGSFAGCPATPPFTATVNLVVFSGNLNLFVTGIDFRFVDPFGVQMPPVTLPAPTVTAQFGTNFVAARSSRRFPIGVRFGCKTDRRGTIFMTVRTTDTMGIATVKNLNVEVQ